jgi:hypothetical protein
MTNTMVYKNNQLQGETIYNGDYNHLQSIYNHLQSIYNQLQWHLQGFTIHLQPAKWQLQ